MPHAYQNTRIEFHILQSFPVTCLNRDDVPELCRILRPVLALSDSRVPQPLNYVRLLQQLRRFAWDAQKIKSQWAQEFYGRTEEDTPTKEAA